GGAAENPAPPPGRPSRADPPLSALCKIEAPPQRAQEHRSQDRSRETAVTAQRPQARFRAETVIEPLENPKEYRAFEDAIVSEYLPRTPVEQELVHRIASLFWRLRRATSIETGLLRMQSEMLHAFRSSRQNAATPSAGVGATVLASSEAESS